MSKNNLKKYVLRQRAKQRAQSITKAWVYDKGNKEDDSFDGFGYDDDDDDYDSDYGLKKLPVEKYTKLLKV